LFHRRKWQRLFGTIERLALEKMPHVIFMDIEMPEMDGIQAISIARSLYPQIFFIVLTIFDDDDKIFEAIKAGAQGYLLKDENAITCTIRSYLLPKTAVLL
jgi:DNA-binding NarL/FixJ family response regulator